MLSVGYAECHIQAFYAGCHYDECHYAECRYAECHYAECQYAECHYAEFHYAECHYAECHYAECCGATAFVSRKPLSNIFQKMKKKIGEENVSNLKVSTDVLKNSRFLKKGIF